LCLYTFCNIRTLGVVRTETVLRRLQQQAPVMSDVEKEALYELKNIAVLLNSYTASIKTV